MTRQTASSYYSDTFEDPQSIYQAQYYALQLLYVCVIITFAFIFLNCGLFFSERRQELKFFINFFICGFVGRTVILVFLAKCFYNVNEAWYVA